MHNTFPDSRLTDNPLRTPEADRRLEALTDVVSEYQSEYPFVLGATVYGSTMHGKANEKSDVDAFIFVDPDVAAELAGAPLEQEDYVELARATERDVLKRVGVDKEQASSGKRSDIQICPMNEGLVDSAITAYEAQQAQYVTYKNREKQLFDQYIESIDSDETFDEYAMRQGFDTSNEPLSPLLDWEMAALFHPTVGGDTAIRSLRQQLLQRIEASPAMNEIWNDVVSRIETFEGDTHHERMKFPATVAQARETFI